MYKDNSTTYGADFATVVEALGGRRVKPNEFMCRCPLHNDRTPSLSIKIREDKVLWNCFAGCDGKDLGRYFMQVTGGTISQSSHQFETVSEERDEWKAAAIQRVWSEGVEISDGDPVHTYLTVTRKIPLKVMPADLRYHSQCKALLDDNVMHTGPAMLSAVRNLSGHLVQVHRTFLTDDGRKADIQSPKRLMPSPYKGVANGCAIRLGLAVDNIVLAEGIESALAASHLSGLPAWSCISAHGLEYVELPEQISTVRIAMDNDSTGEAAACNLAQRLMSANKKVLLFKAPGSGKSDWADVLRGA